MIIADNNVSAVRRQDLEPPNAGLIWVEINSHSKSILFGVFYRPPTAKENLKELQQSLK